MNTTYPPGDAKVDTVLRVDRATLEEELAGGRPASPIGGGGGSESHDGGF